MVKSVICLGDASKQNALFFRKCAPQKTHLFPQCLEQALMVLFALLEHPQYPIFEKCGAKYHMRYLWSLLTPPGSAD